MKKWWTRYAEKVDAASLRERALIFFALAFIVVMLFNTTMIAPMLAKQRGISGEIIQKQSELSLFQEQNQVTLRLRGQDPDAENRKKLEGLKRQLAESEKLIREKGNRLVPPEKIAALLGDILNRNNRLELVELKKLPVAGVSEGPAGQEGKAPSRQIFRHGVEITVKGGYFDLLAYVTELEKSPLRMYWTRMDLAVSDYPTATMKLSVYTLSLDKNWLVV